jgi:hypothetical protein
MPTSQNPAIARILEIPEDGERARQLASFIERGEAALTEARTLRNDLIRKLWAKRWQPTIDALAAAIGVGRHVIIDANRKK